MEQSPQEDLPIEEIELKEGVVYKFKFPCGCIFQWEEDDIHEAFYDLIQKIDLEIQAANN